MAVIADWDDLFDSDISEQENKRLCTGIDSCDEVKDAPLVVDVPVKSNDLTFLPRELLTEIFQCADLVCRGKMRRVCKFWDHFVTKPEINKPVHVTYEFFRFFCTKTGDFNLSRLLGPHVEFFSYSGGGLKDFLGLMEDLQKNDVMLFRLCPAIQHLVLRRVRVSDGNFNEKFRLLLLPLIRDLCSEIRYLTLLSWEITWKPRKLMVRRQQLKWKLNIPRVTIPWTADTLEKFHEATDPVLWPFPVEQTEWVSTFAPKLPESYHTWALAHSCGLDRSVDRPHLHAVNLKTVNYATLPKEILCLLAYCIVEQRSNSGKNGKHAAPPHKFPPL